MLMLSILYHKISNCLHRSIYIKRPILLYHYGGGISTFILLIPPGGVEILFTSWFAPFMPLPNNTRTENKDPICPDFDDRARLALGDSASIHFAVLAIGVPQPLST
jgi:hypothetical protein